MNQIASFLYDMNRATDAAVRSEARRLMETIVKAEEAMQFRRRRSGQYAVITVSAHVIDEMRMLVEVMRLKDQANQ